MERREAHPIGSTLDPSIVERARRGDLEAFESIVRDRMNAVYRLTLAIVGNEADAADATQDAFVAAWRQVRSLRDASRVDAWLGRIAINAARMVVRGRRRRSVREIRGVDAAVVDPASTGFPPADRDGRALAAALERLDPDRRVILALRHLEGRGIPEIAAILGIPEGTAKSRLFSARKALLAALDSAREID
ncbi:MAG TPA: RNA polymerase sigma factor [Candidatus Limnocylindrales bacterium]|nr:RNA polymerase sigma factor [Candidatus Limnocylindrales bacterium]